MPCLGVHGVLITFCCIVMNICIGDNLLMDFHDLIWWLCGTLPLEVGDLCILLIYTRGMDMEVGCKLGTMTNYAWATLDILEETCRLWLGFFLGKMNGRGALGILKEGVEPQMAWEHLVAFKLHGGLYNCNWFENAWVEKCSCRCTGLGGAHHVGGSIWRNIFYGVLYLGTLLVGCTHPRVWRVMLCWNASRVEPCWLDVLTLELDMCHLALECFMCGPIYCLVRFLVVD